MNDDIARRDNAQHEWVDVTSLSDKRQQFSHPRWCVCARCGAGLRSMNDENATVSRVVAAAMQVATAAQQDYPNLHPCCNDSPTHHQEMTQLLNELTAAVTEMLDTQPETCNTPD